MRVAFRYKEWFVLNFHSNLLRLTTIREDEEYSSTTRIQGQVPWGASGSGVKECSVVEAVDVGCSTHHLKDKVLLFILISHTRRKIQFVQKNSHVHS